MAAAAQRGSGPSGAESAGFGSGFAPRPGAADCGAASSTGAAGRLASGRAGTFLAARTAYASAAAALVRKAAAKDRRATAPPNAVPSATPALRATYTMLNPRRPPWGHALAMSACVAGSTTPNANPLSAMAATYTGHQRTAAMSPIIAAVVANPASSTRRPPHRSNAQPPASCPAREAPDDSMSTAPATVSGRPRTKCM